MVSNTYPGRVLVGMVIGAAEPFRRLFRKKMTECFNILRNCAKQYVGFDK